MDTDLTVDNIDPLCLGVRHYTSLYSLIDPVGGTLLTIMLLWTLISLWIV